ncbi:ferritin family protein [bacterium]|nr:ferritin family protein [bacterium]
MATFFNAEEIVRIAVRTEETGCDFYKKAMQNATTPEMKELFSYLAREELKHKAYFEGLLGNVAEIAQGTPADWDEVDLYIKALVEQSLFFGEGRRGDISMAVLSGNEKEAVDHALDFEKDTMLFFYQLLQIVKESVRPSVEAVINEEKQHIKRLVKMKAALT